MQFSTRPQEDITDNENLFIDSLKETINNKYIDVVPHYSRGQLQYITIIASSNKREMAGAMYVKDDMGRHRYELFTIYYRSEGKYLSRISLNAGTTKVSKNKLLFKIPNKTFEWSSIHTFKLYGSECQVNLISQELRTEITSYVNNYLTNYKI